MTTTRVEKVIRRMTTKKAENNKANKNKENEKTHSNKGDDDDGAFKPAPNQQPKETGNVKETPVIENLSTCSHYPDESDAFLLCSVKLIFKSQTIRHEQQNGLFVESAFIIRMYRMRKRPEP